MSQSFFGIMGRKSGEKKMKPFDYKAGRFVTNVMYQTLWDDEDYVQGLVNDMNEANSNYEFKVEKRS